MITTALLDLVGVPDGQGRAIPDAATRATIAHAPVCTLDDLEAAIAAA